MSIVVRALHETDSISELTALLHSAHAQLQRLGFNYTAVDQSEDVTRKRIAGGECYVALDAQRMVGTILFRRHSHGCIWYEQPHVAAIHQFGVLPAAQRRGIGSQLMQLRETRCRRRRGGNRAGYGRRCRASGEMVRATWLSAGLNRAVARQDLSEPHLK